jgi:hypothetical protein
VNQYIYVLARIPTSTSVASAFTSSETAILAAASRSEASASKTWAAVASAAHAQVVPLPSRSPTKKPCQDYLGSAFGT